MYQLLNIVSEFLSPEPVPVWLPISDETSGLVHHPYSMNLKGLEDYTRREIPTLHYPFQTSSDDVEVGTLWFLSL